MQALRLRGRAERTVNALPLVHLGGRMRPPSKPGGLILVCGSLALAECDLVHLGGCALD